MPTFNRSTPAAGSTPTIITEDVLRKLFDSPGKFTSQAKFWNDSTLPTRESIFVDGNVKIQIGDKIQHFKEGAIVFQDPSKGFGALPESARWGGGVTAGGGPVAPMTKPDFSWEYSKGNFATVRAEKGILSLSLPEGRVGFTIPYPGHSAEQLVSAARQQNAIVELKDAYGERIKGFFLQGKSGLDGLGNGGVYPQSFNHYSNPHDHLKAGEFVSFKERTNPKTGELSTTLFKYRAYDAQDAARGYGNNIDKLTLPNGEKINQAKLPHLNVEKVPVEPNYLRAVEIAKASEPKLAVPKKVEAVELPKSQKMLHNIGKYAGPAFLVVGPIVQSSVEAYDSYKKDGSLLDITSSALYGAGKGAVDTFLPGARDGYSSVIGNKKLTVLDRTLNALSDASGTATAIGSTALVAEMAGVVTIPAAIPTGIATGIAGVTNLGVNVVKAAVKATGFAGDDQDGGYVYDLAKLGGHGVSRLAGYAFDTASGATSDRRTANLLPITERVSAADISEELLRSSAKAQQKEASSETKESVR